MGWDFEIEGYRHDPVEGYRWVVLWCGNDRAEADAKFTEAATDRDNGAIRLTWRP